MNGFTNPFHDKAFPSVMVDQLFTALPQFKIMAADAWTDIAEGRFSGLAPLFDDGPFDDGRRVTIAGATYVDERLRKVCRF